MGIAEIKQQVSNPKAIQQHVEFSLPIRQMAPPGFKQPCLRSSTHTADPPSSEIAQQSLREVQVHQAALRFAFVDYNSYYLMFLYLGYFSQNIAEAFRRLFVIQ